VGCDLISTTVPPTTVDVSALATSSALATVDTVVDAIKAVTDNLPESGALTTIDSNIDAIKLVTDALPGACSDVILDLSKLHSNLHLNAPGITTANITGSAATYATALNVTVPGYLWWASCHRGTGFSAGTLNIRVTLDGSVVALSANASTGTTQGDGCVVVGGFSNSTAVLMPLRFNTSLVIEVISSVAQSGGGDMYANYIYTVG